MEHFTKENTTGYGPRHLRDLNEVANEQITEDMDFEEIQSWKEAILKGYDEVRLNMIRLYLCERYYKASLQRGLDLIKGHRIKRKDWKPWNLDSNHIYWLNGIDFDHDEIHAVNKAFRHRLKKVQRYLTDRDLRKHTPAVAAKLQKMGYTRL